MLTEQPVEHIHHEVIVVIVLWEKYFVIFFRHSAGEVVSDQGVEGVQEGFDVSWRDLWEVFFEFGNESIKDVLTFVVVFKSLKFIFNIV